MRNWKKKQGFMQMAVVFVLSSLLLEGCASLGERIMNREPVNDLQEDGSMADEDAKEDRDAMADGDAMADRDAKEDGDAKKAGDSMKDGDVKEDEDARKEEGMAGDGDNATVESRPAFWADREYEHGTMNGKFYFHVVDVYAAEGRDGVAAYGTNYDSPLYVGALVDVIAKDGTLRASAEVYDIELYEQSAIRGGKNYRNTTKSEFVTGVPRASNIGIWLSGLTWEDVKVGDSIVIQKDCLVNDALNELEEAVWEHSLVQLPEEMEYVNAYLEVIRKDLAEWEEYDYALIYLDEDDIPELVTGHTGYYANVYTFHGGQVSLLMDYWPYGAFGNAGYEYVPYKNIIRNYDADYAGLVMYTSYYRANENYEIEEIICLETAWIDEEGHYAVDGSQRCYYFDEGKQIEITKEAYLSYLEEYESQFIDGQYEYIRGDRDAMEIALELYSMAEGRASR